MLDGAAAQQAQGSLSLDWLLHEIEALIPAQQPPAHKAEAHQEELPPPVPHSQARRRGGGGPAASPSPPPPAAGRRRSGRVRKEVVGGYDH